MYNDLSKVIVTSKPNEKCFRIQKVKTAIITCSSFQALASGFEKLKMTSKSLFPSETTLSPYLRLGCLSPRLFYWKLNELYKKVSLSYCLAAFISRIEPDQLASEEVLSYILSSFIYFCKNCVKRSLSKR